MEGGITLLARGCFAHYSAVIFTADEFGTLTVASGHRGCHRLLVLTYDGWASEILHQLKTMVYTIIYGVLTIGVYLFPTCQVRVVRFYQSCSSPPPPSSPPPRFSSTTSASTSMSTSALPTLRQALRQLPHAVATAGPQLQGSERTGHRWTSTWNLPSSVSTAASTWGPPSSVSTAGPQPGTLRAQ